MEFVRSVYFEYVRITYDIAGWCPVYNLVSVVGLFEGVVCSVCMYVCCVTRHSRLRQHSRNVYCI